MVWYDLQAPLNVISSATRSIPIWRDVRLLPAYAAGISVIMLSLTAVVGRGFPPTIFGRKRMKADNGDISDSGPQVVESRQSLKKHIEDLGGPTILAYRLVRVAAVIVLLGLYIVSLIKELTAGRDAVLNGGDLPPGWERTTVLRREGKINIILCATYAYFCALALGTVFARNSVSRTSSLHLTLSLLVSFGVYAYRDIWPLMTFTLMPVDIYEGNVIWGKVMMITIAGVFIPLLVPRRYLPVNPSNPSLQPNPEQIASILSLATYTFLGDVVFRAYHVPHLPFEQFPPLADYDQVSNLVDRSFKYLDVFSGAPKQHLFFGLMRLFRREYSILALMLTFRAFSSFLAPAGINRLLNFIETRGEDAFVRPWVWIFFLFLSPLFSSLVFQWYIFITTRSLVRAQAILTQLVFEHALRIRLKAEVRGDTSGRSNKTANTGQSVNNTSKLNTLIGTDLENIVNGRDFLMLILYSPLQCTISICFLYLLLGWSAFVGLAVMLIAIPIPGTIVRVVQRVQKALMKKTDARVQTVTEMMAVVRMIKMFGWESKISQRVAEKRDEELRLLKSREIFALANQTVNIIIPILTMICTYGTFTVVMKRELTPSIVFSSISIFDMLRNSLSQLMWRVSPTIQAKVSLDRMGDFLHNTELLDIYSDSNTKAATLIGEILTDGNAIGFKNATFTWSADAARSSGTRTPAERDFTLIIDGELSFEHGAINLIIGPTGSGKTSMLMALLGEMHYVPQGLESWVRLPRSRGIAYAAQESWVQNETIKNNIIFGAHFDEERYNKVIYQCGLERDLELFAAGDETEVGEKGFTLSGGQKARVTLARAVYSSADIILLDDILAALDVHTSKWIVDKCLKGDLIVGRTVLLVTHNVALARPIANFVVGLGPDGRVITHGSVSQALAHMDSLQAVLQTDAEIAKKSSDAVDSEPLDKKSAKKAGRLVVKEDIAEGHISWKSLSMFFLALGGSHPVLFWVFFLSTTFLYQICTTGQTWWLGWWAEQYDIHDYADVNIIFYLGVFILIVVLALMVEISSTVTYVYGNIRAAKRIHMMLIDAVLKTTLRWLDTTPTSRVITRCTQDIRNMDSNLSQAFMILCDLTANILVKLTSVLIITPIFILPSIVLAIAGGFISNVYMHAQLSVKREMSNMRAPVLGHFGAAVTGLASIRAYGVQDAFRREAHVRIDKFTRAARTNYNLNRWVSTRIDALSGAFAAGLGAFLVLGSSSKMVLPSNIGFALAMAVGFSNLILYAVRVYNNFELDGNSLERIYAYVHIEEEQKPAQENIPPASWPTSGDLRVEKLSARYSLDGPLVLQDLSFHINSGERVGIVGRTGSGKSSLTLSLLRCIFTEGNVSYDGLDTSCLGLDTLRSNITIIPQVPELLSGTLRENLDPFQEHDDATLNAALRAAGLFSLQSTSGESRITLDSQVSSGGSNLSVGQRQILALARALVRGSKVLILDEATSSIDYETDTIIQSSLRKELGDDVTVLAVAHRLQTIMDADKIMVLDAGCLVEFDKPSVLLQREGGYLKALVDESGDRDTLYRMAGSTDKT